MDECASLTASLSEGFCEIKYDGKLVRTYSDGDCTKETTDSGCTVNGIVQTIPECTVVFTAGKCNDGTGDCDPTAVRNDPDRNPRTYFRR